MNKKDIETQTPIPWKLMTFYQKFEQAVVVTLSGVISLIIIISLFQLIQTVYSLSLNSGFHPMNHQAFQSMFGMIMTLLIAMEFKHSIIQVALRSNNIIQVKTIILIALIALSRKFVILEPGAEPTRIAALAVATISLGGVYWLLNERDDRKQKY